LITTSQKLAEKYGSWTRPSVVMASSHKHRPIVAEHDDPEIRRKLLGADVKLTAGTVKVLLKLSAKERKAAVDKLLTDGELPEPRRRQPQALDPGSWHRRW